MPSQAIYRRWRPQRFEDVFGQEAVTRTLANALASERLAHAYLFTGPRGTGKTSIARILAKAANCVGQPPPPCDQCEPCRSVIDGRSLDLIEIDAASNTGVDDVRDLRDKVAFAPSMGRYKVYIIDEVHMLSTAAFNALLKTLEEPPPHVIFVLATTEPHKLPDTIVSRCQRYDMRRVPVAASAAKLRRICDAEGISADEEALTLIARTATGSMRDAESLLDLLVAGGEAITVERVAEAIGTAGSEAVTGVVAALIDLDAASGLRWINQALDTGADPRQLQSQLVDRLRHILLIQTGLDEELLQAAPDDLALLREQAASLPPRRLAHAIRTISEQEPSVDRSHPGLPLEIAVVELILAAQEPANTAGASQVSATLQKPQEPVNTASASQVVLGQHESQEPGKVAGTSQPAVSIPTPRAPSTKAGAASARGPQAGTSASTAGTAPQPTDASVEELRAHWGELIGRVETRDRNLAALLKDCRAESADGDSVTLGFFYEFHCRRASEPARKAVLREALAGLTGADRDVVCIQVSATTAELQSRPTNKADQAAEDPLIKHAVQELGARVSAVRVPDEGAPSTGDKS
jgi:DNA polymerase-3 subunit gamma/tau